MSPPAFQEKAPATEGTVENAPWVLAWFMASLKSTTMLLVMATPVAPFAGVFVVTWGGIVSGAAPVLKVHGLGTGPDASAFPARS